MSETKRAFIVNVKGWAMFGAVAAETAGKAKYVTAVSCREAGFESVKFTDISAKRDPSLDVWANWEKRANACYTMEYIESARVEAALAQEQI